MLYIKSVNRVKKIQPTPNYVSCVISLINEGILDATFDKLIISLKNVVMELIEKTHSRCKYFDTFNCLFRRYKLFCELFHIGMINVDEYLEVKEKCDNVYADCDKSERRKTDRGF